MGVKGAVTVKDNITTRTTHISHTTNTDGTHYDDDVCLEYLSNSSNNGKIKVLGDLANSSIGITEMLVAEGSHRSRDLDGDRMRQFTINYGDHGNASKSFNKDVFFSNDTELAVKLLLAASPTTTGK